jgi:hypothetical protein
VGTGAIDNVGLTRIGLRRSPADPEVWDVFVSARNYGNTVRSTPLAVQFGGAPIANRLLMLAPGKVGEFSFRFRTKAAGWVEARLLTRDSIAEDNRALLEIPALKTINVAVYTDDPDTLRPALQAHPQIEPAFYPTAAYRPDGKASVVVLDRFAPRLLPKSPSIWLEPPEPAPFRVRTKVMDAKIVRWRADHELAAGLRSQDSRVPEAQVYATSAGDISVAETDAGPIVLARPSMRAVVMGFHPGRSDLRYDLMTPLLLANVFRWFEPDVFRAYDLHGGSAGSVSTALDADVDPATVKVVGEHGELPFTVQGQAIRFFAGVPQTVRVISSGREQVHSLSLPEVAPTAWEPPRSAFRGIPGGIEQAISRDLWQYLAVLGGIGLLVEWLLYGRARQRLTVQSSTPATDAMMRQAS